MTKEIFLIRIVLGVICIILGFVLPIFGVNPLICTPIGLAFGGFSIILAYDEYRKPIK